MRSLIFLFLIPLLSAHAENQTNQKEALSVIKPFAIELKATMQQAMKAGGPVNALKVCNTQAMPISQSHSQSSGWKVKRTSLKVRNTKNQPDQWERQILNYFEDQKAKGVDPKTLTASKTEQQNGITTFRFMKAIPAGGACMACHGQSIDPSLASKIQQLYPQDQATGYQPGDIRGAFSLSKVIAP